MAKPYLELVSLELIEDGTSVAIEYKVWRTKASHDAAEDPAWINTLFLQVPPPSKQAVRQRIIGGGTIQYRRADNGQWEDPTQYLPFNPNGDPQPEWERITVNTDYIAYARNAADRLWNHFLAAEAAGKHRPNDDRAKRLPPAAVSDPYNISADLASLVGLKYEGKDRA